MRVSRRHILTLAGAGFFAPFVARRARAQAYPSRPVRVIVPVAAGGANDTTARLFAQKLSESLAQQFYVENIAARAATAASGPPRGRLRTATRCWRRAATS
jgi:tripartite-type tricarboxylate transporter receptor subunit TctC